MKGLYITTRLKLYTVLIASVLLLSLVSCGVSRSTGSGALYANRKMAPMSLGYSATNDIAMDREVATSSRDSAPQERKLIKRGNLTIRVNSLGDIDGTLDSECQRLGAYITHSQRSDTGYYIHIRVPEARFNEAIDSLSLLGKVEECSINTEDVTDNYYDTASRLETKKILRERLETYLKNSNNMADLVAIEKELNQVQGDIESMQSQYNRLSKEIAYCALDINFTLPPNTTSRGYKWPSLKEKLDELGYVIVDLFTSLVLVVIGLVVMGVPMVCIIAVIYWIGFGNIGLIKKLFKRLGNKPPR